MSRTRVARGGLCVGVVPDAISSPDAGVSASAVRLGLRFDLVAKELRDGAGVEVDEHDRDEDLARGESSNSSTSGGGDDLFPVVLEAAVQGLDRLASVIVELVLLGAHERERLFLLQGVFLGERDGMLLADSVEEFGNVVLFNGRAFLICCFLGQLAQRTGDGGAVAERWVAERLFAGSVRPFLGMKLEGMAFLDAREVGFHVDQTSMFG